MFNDIVYNSQYLTVASTLSAYHPHSRLGVQYHRRTIVKTVAVKSLFVPGHLYRNVQKYSSLHQQTGF